MNATASTLFPHSRPDAGALQPRQRPARGALIDEIAGLAGASAAQKLIADFGGRRVYIPQAPAHGDIVVRSIGLTAALKIARIFGGDRLMVPAHPERARRGKQILAMRRNGLSISAIARAAGCTERYVYKVLARSRGG